LLMIFWLQNISRHMSRFQVFYLILSKYSVYTQLCNMHILERDVYFSCFIYRRINGNRIVKQMIFIIKENEWWVQNCTNLFWICPQDGMTLLQRGRRGSYRSVYLHIVSSQELFTSLLLTSRFAIMCS
jgi:hypothetical protein